MSAAAYWATFAVAALAVVYRAAGAGRLPEPAVAPSQLAVVAPDAAERPLFVRRFLDSPPEAPSVHAPTVAMLADGSLVAAWFGGTREGASDVAIYTSRRGADRETWQPARPLIDRRQATAELGRYVKKLGNPVLHVDDTGRLWLYFVTVSVGGWSGGSISVKHSDDGGHSWSDAMRLITAPLLNCGTLVRSPPVSLADGGVLLPAYHETIRQFGELLRLDARGRLVAKYRMNAGSDSLQPAIVARSAHELTAFHRRGTRSPARLLLNESRDSGQSWSPVRPMEFANPNSSVAAAASHRGDVLLVFNPDENSRSRLAVTRLRDGDSGGEYRLIERGTNDEEYSYPTLIRGDSGVYHLVYTWRRERICQVTFNDAWLDMSGSACEPAVRGTTSVITSSTASAEVNR